jgi:epoxyqueuosine reductase
MSGWVFGCDICQDVCPFNRFQKPTGLPGDFAPRPEILSIDTWQELGEKQFAEMTRKSPLRRPGFAGMRRNLKAAGALWDR